jgi:TolB protein
VIKKVIVAIAAIGVFASCAPTGERRPVSLREKVPPAGSLPGEIAYVQDLAVGESAIYIKNLDTNARTQVDTPPGYASSPAWAPSADEIAYSVTNPRGFSNLWVSPVDGTPRRLTEGQTTDDYPSWSGDGEELVFASIRDEADNWRLYRMSAGGSEPEQVGPTDGQSVFPDWSPTSDEVVFSHRSGDSFKLHVLDLATGDTRALTSGPGDDLFPKFSPDGESVVYSSNRREDVWQLYVVDVDSGDVRRIIGSDSLDRFPDWSPDGDYVVLSSNHLSVYRADGESLPGGALRWKLTTSRAIAPSWR